MKLTLQRLLYTSLIATFFTPVYVLADVPHTFESGTPALASEVNENFSSLDSRVNNLENQQTNPDFSGYSLPYAAEGDPKNVIVLKSLKEWMFEGTYYSETRYYVRTRYRNSTETVSIDGVPTIRPLFAQYTNVLTDDAGQIQQVTNYIDTPDAENYKNYYSEYSEYDPDGSNKIILDDTVKGSEQCVGGVSRICFGFSMSSLNDYNNSWHGGYIRTLMSNYVLDANGWNFDQVSLEVRTNNDRLRVRAKGIGLILQRFGSGSDASEYSAIYYRVNGQTRGSLVGTPFDVGQPLEGLFF